MGVLNDRNRVSVYRPDPRCRRRHTVEEVRDPDVESSALGNSVSDNLWVGDGEAEDVCEDDDGLVLGTFLIGTLGKVRAVLFGAFGGTWKPISRDTVRAVHGGKAALEVRGIEPFLYPSGRVDKSSRRFIDLRHECARAITRTHLAQRYSLCRSADRLHFPRPDSPLHRQTEDHFHLTTMVRTYSRN